MLYVEISRARDRAELVTDDKAALREQLQALTGERIAALEAVGEDEGEGARGREGRGHGCGDRRGTGFGPPGGAGEDARAEVGIDRDLGL